MFWNAVYALEDCLFHYDWNENKRICESDETKLHECLSDFNEIITNLLTTEKLLTKAIAPNFESLAKAGKKMSGKNKQTLSGIYNNLGEFLKEFDDISDESKPKNNDEQEETEVNKEELRNLIKDEIAKSLENKGTGTPAEDENINKSEELTAEFIVNTIRTELAKALNPEEEKPLTADVVKQLIADEIQKAVEPIRKQAGLPSNLNDTPVEKNEEEHYLHGIL